jgi:hypothetical protein
MSEKTEQPTAKKLRDAREKGQVAKSKDFTQTALIVALFAYIISAGKLLMESFSRILVAPFSFIDTDFPCRRGSDGSDDCRDGISAVALHRHRADRWHLFGNHPDRTAVCLRGDQAISQEAECA